MLLTNHLIQHAFAYYCGWRGVYSSLALVWGLAGMALIAWPWLMRDFLETLNKHPRWRPGVWAFSVICALAFAILPFCGRT